MKYRFSIFLLFFALLIGGCLSDEQSKKIAGEDVVGNHAKPQSFQKIAPLTTNALGARKNLHKDGWYFIPSSKKALNRVISDGRMTARTARALLLVQLKEDASKYPNEMAQTMVAARKLLKESQDDWTEANLSILSGTLLLTQLELVFSKELLKKSGNRLIEGYIYLDRTTQKDWQQLSSAFRKFNQMTGATYSSITELFQETSRKNGQKITSSWKGAFHRSMIEFQKEYAESGKRDNSLLALWDLFEGYTVALKEMAFSPSADTVTGSGEFLLVNGIAVPVLYSSTFLAQTVATTGFVIYYPVSVGYRVVSPTLEAGFLSTMGLASAASTAPTLIGGSSIAAFNQVTVVAGTETVRAGGMVVGAGYQTGATATGMVYNIAKGTGESVLYGFRSGVVLTYSALTVIPTHLILSVPDGTIFLAWDGPRLVIARVRGNYKGFESLPVGTIVDLQQARKEGKVEILSDDPKLVKKVLRKQIDSMKTEQKRK